MGTSNYGSTNTVYQGLYKTGAAAALIAALLFRRNIDAEWMMLRATGVIKTGPLAAPGSVPEWFGLLQSDPLLGLTFLGLFDMINYALVALIFLALIAALRQVSPSLAALAGVSTFIGTASYFASNQAFAMLSLSRQYTAAAADAQRTLLVAAGEAVLAVHTSAGYQGAGIYPGFLLVCVAGLILSAAMLRSGVFNRTTAVMGLLANGFGLGYYLMLVFAPALVFVPLSVSAVFLLVWYILVGLRLFRLAQAPASSSMAMQGQAV